MITGSKFKFIGGAVCLDFINTVSGRIGGTRYRIVRDKLASTQDLKIWSELAGIPSARPSPDLLARALAFRESLYRICKSVVEDSTPSKADLARLNRELAIAHSHERLTYSENAFALTSDHSPDRILWSIARSATDLLASEDRTLLRQCGGHECGWMFLDTSRNRSRQWCDMRICGNRTKARNFRQRLRGKTS